MYLENVNGPNDIKKIKKESLQILADEVRCAVINKISKVGGHKGPNLGAVELTVALHYVFTSPIDKFVFDVSHQCYPHKILTGRKKAFLDDNHFSDVTGYTNPLESDHDLFIVGHTSTSISLALGLAKARDLKKTSENIIAIIGDGSLSGGEALEALDYAGEYDKNLIIIVNDNDQSIAENHGGIYKNLKELRETNGGCSHNVFKSLGLDYHYIDDGHNVTKLVEQFESIKDIDHPIVVHVHTIKGKGLKYAEENKEMWHAGGPFNVEDGTLKYPKIEDSTIHDSLVQLLNDNPLSIVLNAGTPMGLGFVGQEKLDYIKKGRFVDVGIAEENAMAMSSGVAKNGGYPVFGTYAPFLQRTYDQLSHDLCLNNNPATILVLEAGVYGMNSNTHLCISDIQLFSHVPNLVYLAPSTKEEYLAMFKYATTQRNHPCAIRVPSKFIISNQIDLTDYSLLNKAQVLNFGKDIALVTFGNLIPLAFEIVNECREKYNKKITLINAKFLSGIDEELMTKLLKDHHLVITLEDGELEGGYGQRISSFFGNTEMKVINLGISKKFHSDFDAKELLREHGISKENLINLILNN